MSQGSEAKKEEFRKYLEKTGVVDQLTRVLVGLYEETDKPPNGVEYIEFKRRYLKKYLGSNADTDVDKLKQDYEKVREDNTRLRKQIE
jgi:hypothetical protein